MNKPTSAFITHHILQYFHETRRPHVKVETDEQGRIGYWNFDHSHFIISFSSEAAAMEEINGELEEEEEESMMLHGCGEYGCCM